MDCPKLKCNGKLKLVSPKKSLNNLIYRCNKCGVNYVENDTAKKLRLTEKK